MLQQLRIRHPRVWPQQMLPQQPAAMMKQSQRKRHAAAVVGLASKLGIEIEPKEIQRQEPAGMLRALLSRWLPLCDSVMGMVVEVITMMLRALPVLVAFNMFRLCVECKRTRPSVDRASMVIRGCVNAKHVASVWLVNVDAIHIIGWNTLMLPSLALLP